MRTPTSASSREALAYVGAARSNLRRAARRSIAAEGPLNGRGYREDMPVCSGEATHHESNGRRSRCVAGNCGRAAVEEVDETVISQDARVPAEVLVVAAIGVRDRRRYAGNGGHHDCI